jgi:glycine cleavage system transcriptional repressor
MQLAITVLGKTHTTFIPDVLAAIANYKCHILELSVSHLSQSTIAAYLLVEGNWNYLAKLENNLENLQKRLEIKVHSLHTEEKKNTDDLIPYNLETISIDREGTIQDMLTFLLTHHIAIAEIKTNCYPALYSYTPVLSTKFIILIPADIQLISFREELLNFCDNCNVDAIFEPLKR